MIEKWKQLWHYLFLSLEEPIIIMAHWIPILKTLIKTSVDNYVLPGTATGTEILWIYMIQWKRGISAITFAVIYGVYAQFDLMREEKSISYPDKNQKQS